MPSLWSTIVLASNISTPLRLTVPQKPSALTRDRAKKLAKCTCGHSFLRGGSLEPEAAVGEAEQLLRRFLLHLGNHGEATERHVHLEVLALAELADELHLADGRARLLAVESHVEGPFHILDKPLACDRQLTIGGGHRQ